MRFEHYVRSGQKELRCGFTTGTCAALAAISAAEAVFAKSIPEKVHMMTAKGLAVEVTIYDGAVGHIHESCEDRMDLLLKEKESLKEASWSSVIKDAGDDSDVTDGAEVISSVVLTKDPGITIDAGLGIGRVTKPGLDQPVGNAAINSGPRKYIAAEVQKVLDDHGYEGGAIVIVAIPLGSSLAKKTFNPFMGIEGGISVLGTSGIVEPMSEKALIDTIEVTVNQAALKADRLIITPGNYGEKFIEAEDYMKYNVPYVKCSNFIGETLDMAIVKGFRQVVLIGHMGKFVKLAAGIMNTHSRYADGRNEIFCAYSALNGADQNICKEIMEAGTTDAWMEIIEKVGIKDAVVQMITDRIQWHLDKRVKGACEVGAVIFSNVYGTLGITKTAEKVLKEWS